jgi:hypothetical protein
VSAQVWEAGIRVPVEPEFHLCAQNPHLAAFPASSRIQSKVNPMRAVSQAKARETKCEPGWKAE